MPQRSLINKKINISTIVIILSILFIQCASDPIMRISFYNDTDGLIIERMDTVYETVLERNIERFDITSYVTIGTLPREINQNEIKYNLTMSGYNEFNRLLFIYIDERYYIINPELLSNILMNYGIIDRLMRNYYIRISVLLKELEIDVNDHENVIFYYKSLINR
jgi:hypothetical protein